MKSFEDKKYRIEYILGINSSNIFQKSEHKHHKYIRKEGDKYIYADVTHARFGRGTVTDFNESKGHVTINFPEHGEKLLIDKFANLTIHSDNDDTLNREREKVDIANPIRGTEKFSTEEKGKVEREKTNKKVKPPVEVTDVTIIHATEKAYRVLQGGKEFWIPKVWASSVDGERILSIKSTASKKFINSASEAKDVLKPIISDKLTIVKETDKAYLIGMKIKKMNGEEVPIEIWFPKSKVTKKEDNKLEVDGRFWQEKEREIGDKHGEVEGSKPSITTDKAIGYSISVYENLSEQSVSRTLWFPKSQVKELDNGSYIIPKWMYDKRIEELYDSVKTGAWQSTNDGTFELDGINRFNKSKVEILKAFQILGL